MKKISGSIILCDNGEVFIEMENGSYCWVYPNGAKRFIEKEIELLKLEGDDSNEVSHHI